MSFLIETSFWPRIFRPSSLPIVHLSIFKINVSEVNPWENLIQNRTLASLIISFEYPSGLELNRLKVSPASLIIMSLMACCGKDLDSFISASLWKSFTYTGYECVFKYSLICFTRFTAYELEILLKWRFAFPCK